MHKIRKNPRLSAVKLATELEKRFAIKVSPETVRRVIRSYGYNSRVARRKCFVGNEGTRKVRRNFAKSMLDKDISFWESVIFVDESKFNIFGSDGRIGVWRKPNEELNPKNLLPTVKHGGGGIMVCGCFAASGMENLVSLKRIWTNISILKENLKISEPKLGIQSTIKLYQDNDPKHTAVNIRLLLLYNCPKVIKILPYSSDLNPIENVWHELERRTRKHDISSKKQLKAVLTEEWNKIEHSYTHTKKKN
ncbi:Transposable element Tc1 transposase [Araneus ventricosus]|uniref:Transposable element Tc1 transposase n=1 Tax=Araneus ventricosus TaxID=182803 RepID=A0A4Y2HSY7_ARAVE|nr:Transposable element Tc1 transposase [Araneus ventricosus]